MSNMNIEAVQRYMIFDYLNTGTTEEPSWVRMNRGFNTLDESPSAQMDDGVTYIGDKAASAGVKGYKPQFAFDTNLFVTEAAVMKIYNIGRNQETGGDAEADYVRIETFLPVDGKDNTYQARKFRVAVEVASIAGGGGEKIKVTGNLHGVGDFSVGEFNTVTRAFTPEAEATVGELGVLSVLSEPGAAVGGTKITIAPKAALGNSYKHKIAASPTLPSMNQVLTTGWTTWDGVADITATAGQKIVVAEVDTDNKAKKAGVASIVVKA